MKLLNHTQALFNVAKSDGKVTQDEVNAIYDSVEVAPVGFWNSLFGAGRGSSREYLRSTLSDQKQFYTDDAFEHAALRSFGQQVSKADFSEFLESYNASTYSGE